MRITLLLLALILLPSVASAQRLILPTVSFAAVQLLDVVSTEQALHRPGAYEANPIAQSTGARLALKAGTTAGVVWLAAKVGRTHPKAARVFLWSASASVALIAAHNYEISKNRN
jgi:hypothetical protein